VGGIIGNRLFHQQMFPPAEKFAANLEMRVCGGGNRSGVNQLGKLLESGDGTRTELRRAFLCDSRIRVVNRGEVGPSQLGVKPRMILPDVADPDYPNARFLHVSFSRNHS